MKKLKGLLYIVIFFSFLSGCAAPKNWTATSGSRADGIIKLSYEYGLFEVPKVNNEQGIRVASEKCKAWGYKSAEAFGGVIRQCTNYSSNGCDRWLVTAEFQCLTTLRVSDLYPDSGKVGIYFHNQSVEDMVPSGPAQMAGVKVGDKILSADGTPLTGDDAHDAGLIVGEVGTSVTLKIFRGDELVIIPIVRN